MKEDVVGYETLIVEKRGHVGWLIFNRPESLGGPRPAPLGASDNLDQMGIDPLEVGRIVRGAIERNDLYIFTHPEMKHFALARHQQIAAAFDAEATRRAKAHKGV